MRRAFASSHAQQEELDQAKTTILKLERQIEQNERVKSELTKRLTAQEDSCLALVETNAGLSSQVKMLQDSLTVLVEETDIQNKRLENAEKVANADKSDSIADVTLKERSFE